MPSQSVSVRFTVRLRASCCDESRNRVATNPVTRKDRTRAGFRSKSCGLPSRRRVSLACDGIPPVGFAAFKRSEGPTTSGLRYNGFVSSPIRTEACVSGADFTTFDAFTYCSVKAFLRIVPGSVPESTRAVRSNVRDPFETFGKVNAGQGLIVPAV